MEANGTNSHADTPSAESMIGQVLGNPDTVHRIEKILSGIRDAKPPTDREEGNAPAAASGGLSGDLLSDPAILEQLPRMMQLLKPIMASAQANHGERGDAEKPPRDCRRDLLLALKPFLSPAKRSAVDTILRLSGLGAVLRQL